ncbi:MAG: M14 family zinc carboxypeptidase [Rubricoccaceae bacterium]
MRLADLNLAGLRFRSSADVFEALRAACETNPDVAQFETIGHSEQGRPIAGVTLGYGPRTVSLVAGAHADEPVGPETLRTLVLEGLAARDWDAPGGGLGPLFERVTLRIVPHVNPDGEARNAAWIRAWPDLGAFLRERRREPPGRDLEFGYPALRAENRAATAFLFGAGPVTLHASLHGMAFSEGALVLVEKAWLPRADAFLSAFRALAAAAGLRLHDHDRTREPGGDKGFAYGGPGVWTTPEGAAMRAYFERTGDPETAALFHRSSMEEAIAAAERHGAARPRCFVTELPLFQLAAAYEPVPGEPALLRRWQALLPGLATAAADPERLAALAAPFGVRPLPLETAVRVHLGLLDAALGDVLGDVLGEAPE